MIIYLVNSDDGPVCAYTCYETAVEEAALGIAAGHYGGYSKQDLAAIKSDIKNGSRSYTYWIEEMELNNTETVSSDSFKVTVSSESFKIQRI